MDIRGHWSVLLAPLIPLTCGIYLVNHFDVSPGQTLDKIHHVLSRQPPFEWTIVTDLTAWLIVGFGLFLLAERLVWLATTRVEVMKHGIEHRTGLLRQYTSHIQFKDAECLSLYQSGLGALLGYGTLTIHGRGSATITLPDVATARDLMQYVDRQIQRSAQAGPQATSAATDEPPLVAPAERKTAVAG